MKQSELSKMHGGPYTPKPVQIVSRKFHREPKQHERIWVLRSVGEILVDVDIFWDGICWDKRIKKALGGLMLREQTRDYVTSKRRDTCFAFNVIQCDLFLPPDRRTVRHLEADKHIGGIAGGDTPVTILWAEAAVKRRKNTRSPANVVDVVMWWLCHRRSTRCSGGGVGHPKRSSGAEGGVDTDVTPSGEPQRCPSPPCRGGGAVPPRQRLGAHLRSDEGHVV